MTPVEEKTHKMAKGVAYVTVFNSSAYLDCHIPSSGRSSACWLLSCFHNPPNSDMDYRSFNVHTYMVVRMRAYTHWGGWGTPTASQHNLFDSENPTVFLVLLAGFE